MGQSTKWSSKFLGLQLKGERGKTAQVAGPVATQGVPRRYVNNQREHYEFRFNGTLGAEAKQDEVQLLNLQACLTSQQVTQTELA